MGKKVYIWPNLLSPLVVNIFGLWEEANVSNARPCKLYFSTRTLMMHAFRTASLQSVRRAIIVWLDDTCPVTTGHAKVHYVVLGKKLWSDWCFFIPKQTKQINSLCFHDLTNWINKLNLKDNRVSYCFNLFICGGPCHLSSFQQCSLDLIFLWEQLVYSVMEKSLYDFLINIVKIKILKLNFFSKTTECSCNFWIPSEKVFVCMKWARTHVCAGHQ